MGFGEQLNLTGLVLSVPMWTGEVHDEERSPARQPLIRIRSAEKFPMFKSWLVGYLLKRFDSPLAWVKVYGGLGLVGGMVAACMQAGWQGALPGAFVGGVIASTVGLLMGLALWTGLRLCAGRPERLVQRPHLWGWPLACPDCGWHTTPAGPWRLHDCLSPPDECPRCGAILFLVVPACPECGAVRRGRFRWPRSIRQAWWGGATCSECGCEYDKWGRRVTN